MNDAVINTEQLRNLTSKLSTTPPLNFCIAPFQSIRQNAYGRNSPCAFGAGEWHHGDLSPAERWNSKELNQLRQEFINNDRPTACHRCWAEEDAGKQSLRQRQYEYFPNDYEKFVRSGNWVNGPKTAVFKVSNVCNLACRSCGGWDTNTYTVEGQYYLDKYNTRTPSNKLHNRFIPLLPPKHIDFSQYYDIAGNLEKIDFFGGEPFLNTSQLELLEYLSNKGISKNITLFYSTNCTNYPTERLKKVWNEFKRIEISVSIDGINDQFEYMRYPAKWAEVDANMEKFLQLGKEFGNIYFSWCITLSASNIYNVPETLEYYYKKYAGQNVGMYLNLVHWPIHHNIGSLPIEIKKAVEQRLLSVPKEYTQAWEHIPGVVNFMNNGTSDLQEFDNFLKTTATSDKYRNQNFKETFKEYGAYFDTSCL